VKKLSKIPSYQTLIIAGLLKQLKKPAPPSTTYWVTKKEEKILIKNMSNTYVINSILFLLKHRKTIRKLAYKLQHEEVLAGEAMLGMLRGEMAIMTVGNDLDYMYDKLHYIENTSSLEYLISTIPFIALCKSLKTRNISLENILKIMEPSK